MKTVNSLAFNLLVIFNSIKLSSQLDLFPDEDLNLSVPRRGHTSPSPDRNHPHQIDLNHPPAESSSRARWQSPAASVQSSTRITNLPRMLPSPDGSGCALEKMRFIRLISRSNEHRIFELRRYTFPPTKLIKIRKGYNAYEAIPTQEYIVLSTSDGDVFAILETFNILAGIYTNAFCDMRRAKINMESSLITPLTHAEINETQVGARRLIMKNYVIEHLDHRANSSLGH